MADLETFPPPEWTPPVPHWKERADETLRRLMQPVPSLMLLAVGAALLLIGLGTERLMRRTVLQIQDVTAAARRAEDQSESATSHFRSLAELKDHDLNQFKAGMSTQAQSKKMLYETGLSLQEEKRLLEKQWEIITTYLAVDIGLQRIFLMRGDQPLESYLISYVPLKGFGRLPTNVPRVVRIVSKERFAHPERGNSEMVNGKLEWEPPQVGTSVRSNALGEYVMFTSSRLILHGPPRNPEDHEAFPHLCVGLSLDAARSLYQHSFIGTKIVLTSMKEALAREEAIKAAANSFSAPASSGPAISITPHAN
jgi:hypothetical protein